MNRNLFSARLKILFSALILCIAAQTAISQTGDEFSINKSPLPAPTGYVNDYAGVIDAATKERLEKRIDDFKKQTNPSVEIAVAVVDTTGGRDIFEYSLAVARGWGIGTKEDDNPSALLFIAISDRKYFTQVSKDLEDELPDGLVGQLQRQNLVPEFKKGNYGQGIENTINAYIQTIEGKTGTVAVPVSPTPQQKSRPGFSKLPFNCYCMIFIGIIVLISIIRSFFGGGKGGRGGGGGGLGDALPWIIGSAIINSSGGSSWGSGGSSSSDWSSGGSSDWGGFGGGGDFGGGGAGGDW